MYKIGEFSTLSKTTIKTLRYYEKEKLLLPSFVDENGYRYYEANKLLELCKILSLKQIGFSIVEIRKIIQGAELDNFLNNKLKELENLQTETNFKISKIKYLLGEKNMKYEVFTKELPECIVYYKEGELKSYGEAGQFILQSANECLQSNPQTKCVEPDYCFMEYLHNEHKDKDIKVRYSQAVKEFGKDTDTIKFKKLETTKAVCVYHKGDYSSLGEAYGCVLKYIEENNLKIKSFPRERYIDGVWNKQSVDEWLTEIQVPIE